MSGSMGDTLANALSSPVDQTAEVLRERDRLRVDRLREVLRYDETSGFLYWRFQKPGRLKAGQRAGTTRKDGRRKVTVDYITQLENRVVWAIVHGYFPVEEIDHKDTNPSNNSLSNLRRATRAQNEMNKPIMRTNSSGSKGIVWCKARSKWQAQIGLDGKTVFLGRFDDRKAAEAAREAAQSVMFGEFAR